MGLDQEVTDPELTEKVDEYDVAEEVFDDVPLGDEEETTPSETEEFKPVSQVDQNQSEKSQSLFLKKHKPFG